MFFATVAREGVFCAGCRLLFLLGCENLGEVLLAAVFSATGSSAAISGGFCMGWGSGAADADGAGGPQPCGGGARPSNYINRILLGLIRTTTGPLPNGQHDRQQAQ